MHRAEARKALLAVATDIEMAILDVVGQADMTPDEIRTAMRACIRETAAEFEDYLYHDYPFTPSRRRNDGGTPAGRGGQSGQSAFKLVVTDGDETCYRHKEALKDLGFSWNPDRKAWTGTFSREDADRLMDSDTLRRLSVSIREA
ncbi:MAG: hypothetical protein PHZ19_05025 [Candidatus Thermoplasmatota archaeon]|nr:hypothetical protein [Candidatus Thermoplasmatota archaeon]